MKKIAVLVESLFEESELIYPYHRLRGDFEVVLVGSEKDVEYPSKAGYKVKSDISSMKLIQVSLMEYIYHGGYHQTE